MEHILSLEKDYEEQLNDLFENINEGNTILILGAGASVGEKKYLSQQVIEYYEAKKNTFYNISNITEFVDVLEKTKGFDRKEFDRYVYELLNNLEVTEAHRTIASIPWRQIITTNYDLLIEKAFDKIRGTSEHVKDIVPVRSIQEYNNLTEINEIKYIKLHGCMSDKSKYPFVFSTKDYSKVKKFYRSVLNSLKSPSDKIKIVSIGYSFEDTFAYSFLKTLDSENSLVST